MVGKNLLPSFDFHVHTHYSKDSPMNPRKIIRVAKMKGLEGIAVIDHNTIRGGIDVARQAESGFNVIIGSEIRTETCEIVCLFLNDEIRSTDTLEVIDRIKSQGGLAILPHPFRSNSIFHKTSNATLIKIAEKVDAIEVFNARTRFAFNEKVRLLTVRMNKPMVAGSDAHFYWEIGNAKTILPLFNSEGELKKNILEGKTTVESSSHTFICSLPFRFLGFLYSGIKKLHDDHVN